MISISITTDGDYSAPMFVSRDTTLGVSIHSPGAQWTGTIELQRLPAENSMTYPLHSDTGFITYLSKTGDYEDSLADLAPGWYRFKATAAIANTADCKIW